MGFFSSKHAGTVKFFNQKKGFGFATDAKTGKDVALKSKDFKGKDISLVVEGSSVTFTPISGEKNAQGKVFPNPRGDSWNLKA